MNDLKFDYYRANEAEQFCFYRIPKLLFTDKRFSFLSAEAKILYGMLLDRMSLSAKNGWIDDENHVYIYFKLEDAMEFLGVGKDKGVKLFAELDDEKGCGLIKRKRQGLGKPTIIYVMNFASAMEEESDGDKEESESDTEQTSEKAKSEGRDGVEVLTSEKPKSGLQDITTSRLLKNRSQEFGKTDTNNTQFINNKKNYTEDIKTYPISSNYKQGEVPEWEYADMSDEMEERYKYKHLVKENIDYHCLLTNYDRESIDGIVDLMVDAICSKKCSIVIGCEPIPQACVKSTFLKLDYTHIEYVMDVLKKTTTKIRNIKSYILTSLYNARSTIGHHYTAEVNHDFYGA